MKVILAEQLFRWMDEHNIHSVTKEQLEKFSAVPNPDGDFGRGAIHALKYTIHQIQNNLAMWETTPLLACATCKYLQPDVDVCLCEQSMRYAKFVDRMMNCEKWSYIKDESNNS